MIGAIRIPSGLPPAPAKQLQELIDGVIPAAVDAQPAVRWPGAVVRRYRDTLYLLPDTAYEPLAPALPIAADRLMVRLGRSLGSLELEISENGGIAPDLVARGLTVRFRAGGERLRVSRRGHRQSLKHLLQEAGVVPWMRQHLPLLYAEGALVAVADLWIAEDAWRPQGYAVRWSDKPPIF